MGKKEKNTVILTTKCQNDPYMQPTYIKQTRVNDNLFLKNPSYFWSLHKQFRHQILLTHDLLHNILLNGYLYQEKGRDY